MLKPWVDGIVFVVVETVITNVRVVTFTKPAKKIIATELMAAVATTTIVVLKSFVGAFRLLESKWDFQYWKSHSPRSVAKSWTHIVSKLIAKALF
ncbi:hypothetical protein D3C87_1716890 [compost metagenome]